MPHEEQREKNIRLVTEVALDCFLANGIEKTKVADIALRSGLTERSAFRYFETKADLVLAASLLYWKRILERIDRMSHAASGGGTTGLQDAENVLVCYSQLYHLDPNGMRFTLDAELTLHTAGRLHEIKNQPPEPFETSGGPMAKAIRKGLADGSISPEVDVCEANNRAIENMEIMHAQGADKDKFFYCNLDIPYSDDEDCVEHICEQVSRKILKPMRENYGVDTSDAAIRAAVSEHNEVCRILTEIGETRKLDNPPITGYEYAVLVLVSYVCPKRLILPLLRETLAEVKAREVDAQKNYRVRVAVVGSEIDDPDLIRLIESCGALVVADRYCYGSFPGRQEIVLTDGEDALTQVCRWYLQHTECPRQSALHRVQYRNDHVAQLVHDFKADGAIYEQMKFCTYWSYERVIANQVMPRDYGIHILSIDRPYIAGQSGQLRTRVQAFVESLEMKQLRSAQKEDN